MIDVALGVILNLLILSAIGIGPALVFLSAEKRLEVALAIAPALGFALTSVFGTYFILLDKPVAEWAIPWLFISTVISIALSFFAFKKYQLKLALVNWQLLKVFAMGLGLTTLLVLFPMVLGGLDFTTLRGNGSDTFNYIAIAGYLDREPYSWASQVDIKMLIEKHPSYVLAASLLDTRWTTSAMLAFTSRIAGHPIYYFEYGFTALCFILSVGPAFWLALSTRIKPLSAILLSVAISVGFWGQFVLDIRAMSQMNSIPILLLICLLIVRIESNLKIAFPGEIMLLPIAIISLMVFYIEIFPMLVLGLVIFWVVRLVQGVTSIFQLRSYLISLGIIIVGVLPLLNLLMTFLMRQFKSAANDGKNWDQPYFTWFYKNPISGLWGLPHILLGKAVQIVFLPDTLNAVIISLGILLTIILACSLFKSFFTKGYPEATLLSSSLALAALTQFFVFWSRGQFWAAGKGISFGYPFIMISAVGFALTSSPIQNYKYSSFISKFIKIGIITWLTIQCSLGFYRISFAFRNPEYPNYIWFHGEYRNHDWNTKPFKILQQHHNSTVLLLISNETVAQYVSYVFGGDVHLVNFFEAQGSKTVINQQALSKLPDYVMAEKSLWQNIDDISTEIIAQNSDLLLIKTPKDFWEKPLLLAIDNPNGLEFDPGKKTWFWMGGKPTKIKIFSPFKGEVRLIARFFMGPSLPDQSQRRVAFSSSADKKPQELRLGEGTVDINLPVNQGINEVTLQALDEPTMKVLPSGDNRPMLLRVDKLQIRLGRAIN